MRIASSASGQSHNTGEEERKEEHRFRSENNQEVIFIELFRPDLYSVMLILLSFHFNVELNFICPLNTVAHSIDPPERC